MVQVATSGNAFSGTRWMNWIDRFRSWSALTLPDDLLARLRWVLVRACILMAVLRIIHVATAGVPRLVWAAVTLGLVWLCWRWISRYRGAKASWFGDVAEGAILFGVAAAFNPSTALGLLYFSIFYRSLYGPGRRVLVAWLLTTGVFAGALVVETRSVQTLLSGVLLYQIIGFGATALLMYMLSTSLSALRLSRADARFRALVQNGSDLISVVDAQGVRTYASPAYERVLGYRPDELVDRPVGDINDPAHSDLDRRVFAELIEQPGATRRFETRVRHHDGQFRWLDVVASNHLDDPGVGGIVVNSRDVTDRKALEERLRHQAQHDSLTGLPNRALFLDRLGQALDLAAHRRRRPEAVPILFLDLDGFKVINDGLGHAVGDRLLVAVGRRLASALRSGDLLARFGGDEFAVLLDHTHDHSEAIGVAERLLAALTKPFALEDREVLISASVGVVLSSPSIADPSNLLRAADVALYRAKAAGKGGVAVFDPARDEPALGRLELETSLRHALERGELRLAFQPVIQLATGVVAGIEALVRWQHPERGLLSPEAFVPLAEETGFILPMGRWVRAEACRQIQEWRTRYPTHVPLRLSMNLSPREFRQPELVADVAQTLNRTGLSANSVVLEITESAAIADPHIAIATLQALTELGVHLAIDDFGIGYASLNSLKRFPIDGLKIDPSFVAGLGHSQEDTAIVRATIVVAKALGLTVTAEGVETSTQLDQLRELGCDLGQGRFFAPPLSAENLDLCFRRQAAAATQLPEARARL